MARGNPNTNYDWKEKCISVPETLREPLGETFRFRDCNLQFENANENWIEHSVTVASSIEYIKSIHLEICVI